MLASALISLSWRSSEPLLAQRFFASRLRSDREGFFEEGFWLLRMQHSDKYASKRLETVGIDNK